ncbi:hypothetical protein NWQ34_04010 [Mycoplasmopsis felis]|uniref:hypothetical protein n=1 Tax=Mycoplasmopsis felis TaxID=33923 RepID=UPI0021E0F590|nr:hypothetical protein [Mycoplasmopsis felis]MCU9938773.1 hypothetical protein [Mycoplasmopsis felis]
MHHWSASYPETALRTSPEKSIDETIAINDKNHTPIYYNPYGESHENHTTVQNSIEILILQIIFTLY